MRQGRRGARARAWGLAGAAALLLASSVARADAPPSFELAWSEAEGCSSRERIVDATRARLAQSRSDAPPELFAQGTVTKERGGFFVVLAVRDTTGRTLGEREVHVEGTSCTAVEEAAALVLAMMIAASPRAEPGTAPQPRATNADAGGEKPPAAPKPPPPQATPAPSRTKAPRLSIGAAGVASLGVLPDAGVGFAIRAAYSPGELFWIGLEATFEAGGSIRAAQREVGFQFLHAAAFAGAQVLRVGAFEVVVTAAVRAGAIRVLPSGFAVIESDARAAVVAGPGALVRANLAPHLFVEAFPEMDAVFIRDSFEVRDGSQVPIHRPDLFAPRLSLGLAYEFR